MSLLKTYAVGCEGAALARRMEMPQVTRLAIFRSCVKKGPEEHSSVRARRSAKYRGWTRVRKDFPIFADKPEIGSTTIAFDLCPVCSGYLTENV